MGLHKSIDLYSPTRFDRALGSRNQTWRFGWPNTADFNFNYYKLLADAEQSAIGQNHDPNIHIAIIGAGVAGLTAARELFRCGYTKIDIYEASDRIAGRNYSRPVDGQYTVFEMGAMRMPFFTHPGSHNSVLDYYRNRFQIATQNFPNPGSTMVDTGIYLNNGYGPDTQNPYPCPQLDIWEQGQNLPPTQSLQDVYTKWTNFATMVRGEFEKRYQEDGWTKFWHQFVQKYWDKNFRELVYTKAIEKYDENNSGWFGGLGMSEKEARLFSTIGAGDGGWGAFYDISCLYPIRTLLFGFSDNLQLIQGTFDPQGNFAPGPKYNQATVDSLSNPLASPGYLGVQTFAECLFYQPVISPNVENMSLYEASQLPKLYSIHLYTQTKVNKVRHIENSNTIEVTADGLNEPKTYDIVILSPPTWASQMSIDFEGFDYQTQLPFDVTYSIKVSHWITSCKVFYPLKERYWENSNIPPVISTDSYLQGVYGYAVETSFQKDDPGVLLVSYIWEDDVNKLIAELNNDEAFAKKCLDELDKILCQCENIKTPISPYVDTSKPAVIQWAKMPSYRGCAKLYREMTWNENYTLLKYNQKFSAASNLYFAGEAFSVEGGWTEPAFRGALDAVIHVIKNTGGTFLNNFQYSDYPQYDDWNPFFERKHKNLNV